MLKPRKSKEASNYLMNTSCIKHSPTGIYLFKVNDGNIRTMCEICSKLAIKTPLRRQKCCSGVFIGNFEQISQVVLVFPLLILNKCVLARTSSSIFTFFNMKIAILQHNNLPHKNSLKLFCQKYDARDSIFYFTFR